MAGVPVTVLAVATGDPRLVAFLAVTVPVLVGGALVNVFRPRSHPDLFGGVETPLGNTAAIMVCSGPALGPAAAGPTTVLLSGELRSVPAHRAARGRW